MKNFHEKIEALLFYAITNKTYLANATLTDLSHIQYKIDVMPEESKDNNTNGKSSLRHVSLLQHESIHENTITCIKLYIKIPQHFPEENHPATLVITLENQQKIMIHFNASLKKIEQDTNDLFPFINIYKTFKKLNAPQLNWDEEYNEIYSDDELQDDYKKIHQAIIAEVNLLISQFKKMEGHSFKKLNFIDGGCGNSSLLINLKRSQNYSDLELKCLGFDSHERNIERLNESYGKYHNPENGDINYISGDLTASDTVIANAQTKTRGLLHPKETGVRTIMTISGVLTRFVLHVEDTIKALQAICHSGVDAIICSGFNDATFNEHIAKRIGIKWSALQNGTFPVYLLEPLSPEKICAQKMVSFEKKKTSTLDLSLCSYPLYVIEHFDEKLKPLVETIDLSFCRPQDLDCQLLANLLKNYPHLKTIFYYQSTHNARQLLPLKDNEHFPKNIELQIKILKKSYREIKYADEISLEECKMSWDNEAYFMSKNMLKNVYGPYLQNSIQSGFFSITNIVESKPTITQSDEPHNITVSTNRSQNKLCRTS